MKRRAALALAAGWPLLPTRAQDDPYALLKAGGVVLALRHALAPGTFDPPEFRVDDCRTQRNLNDEGRAQARRIGAALRARALEPVRVRSSPWCRCVDTAELVFGRAERWAALGSPRGREEATNAESLAALRGAIGAVARGRFEVWVTHMFVLQDLAGVGTASGEGLVLDLDATGAVRVRARLPSPA